MPNLIHGKSPHNKRRGLSETPEIQRKSRKLFAARTRDIDKVDQNEKHRKRSLTNPRSSVDETESSRKSSVSSKRSKENKQFAVTLLVSESDKTKIMDMLHKAKSVISRKVEKVMGKKAAKSQISNADALKTVLQNWVEEEETKELQEDLEDLEFMKAQEEQIANLRTQGHNPPVQIRPIPTTLVSPVPEESDEEVDQDIEVQEVFEGQTSLLLPPKAKFKLPNLSPTPPMSPSRSLTPCESVPRPVFLRGQDIYKLRRPSSHYDANAQAASSRPTSRLEENISISRLEENISPPVFDYSAFARAKAFQLQDESKMIWEEEDEEITKIQRPESMIIPIGGVWRPDDEPVEDFFLDNDKEQDHSKITV